MSATTAALGNRVDIPVSTVSFWVNQAQMDVWNLLPHELQEGIAVSSTTLNEDKITLPSDFQELIALSNTSRSNALLNPINVDQLAAYSDASGIPTHYALYSNWLELRPIPDSSYSISLRYRKQLSEMTLTTAVPSVASRLRPAIFHRAVHLIAKNVTRDDATAQGANADFGNAMSLPSDRALRAREQHTMSCALPRERGQTTRNSGYSFDARVD